jgi:hypothetical protein
MTEGAYSEETLPAHGLLEFAMAPIVFLCLLFQHFADTLVRMKRVRRAQMEARINFREHWEGLRLNEWLMAQIIGEGARRLIAGEALDLHTIPATADIPESFAAPCPSSAREMHRRFTALAAFHADPETVIRRRAVRITREIACAPRDDAAPSCVAHPAHAPARVLAPP